MGYDSAFLGTAVPVRCVLHLAGALATAGRDAQLRLETLDPGRRAVIVHERRRFSLALVCAGLDELCRHPGCDFPAPHPQIVFCDEHLADCSTATLTKMARGWGLSQNPDDSLGRREGSPEAELIARAAGAAGACDSVIAVLVDTVFPQHTSQPGNEDWALCRARERERHRLTRIGQAEAQRIRRAAGQCATCGSALSVQVPAGFPPQFCSVSCVSPPRHAQSQVRETKQTVRA
ncbi:hypothetical protein [Streptomyces finlayi]|uniref:hypothetical protein n=1 Tax=Streptomyces finlayi TaxID=67296 RepID=UPI0016758C96|nr:hypothetical protein [Streptomyces finlayi]